MKSIVPLSLALAVLVGGFGGCAPSSPGRLEGVPEETDGPPVPPASLSEWSGRKRAEKPDAMTGVVEAMRLSIQNGEIENVSYDQVRFWRVLDDEVVDGVPYQVGIAAYDVASLFGLKTLQAKAWVADGKVKRWVGPEPGLGMR